MQQCLHAGNGKPTSGENVASISKAGSRQWDDTLNAWIEPHHTHAAKTLFGGDSDQRETEPIEGVRWGSDFARIGW